jgi:ABC-type transport system involved in multi-copper enzyme maturation permease subunit
MSILQLIQLEWLKYRKNTTFKVTMILYLVLLPALPAILLSFDTLPPPLPTPASFFNIPEIWALLAYTGNWLAYFLFGFLGVYIISVDSTNKTLRQSVINGLTRRQVILAKLFSLLTIAIMATLYYVITVFILGNFGEAPFEGTPLFGQDYIILRFFLMCLSYLVFGFLIGLLIKSIGVATMLYFLYVFFIEAIIRYLVHLNLFKESRSMIFYPMNAVEDLTPFPFGAKEASSGMNLEFELYMTPFEATMTSSIYLVLFTVSIVYLMIKRDM